MIKRLFLGGAAVVFTTSSAFAADFVEPAAYDWTGLYIGAHAGYGEADVDYKFRTDGHFNNNPGDKFSEDLDGFIGGGHIGFNWQLDNLVVGLESAFTWLGFDETSTSPFQAICACDEFKTEIDWVATITPRLGLALDNALFYVKGGVAFADIKAYIETDEEFVETKKTQTGWTIGGGVEYALSENWIIGAEGNYYDFGSFDASENARDLITGQERDFGSDHDVDTTMWSVLARVSYKFN